METVSLVKIKNKMAPRNFCQRAGLSLLLSLCLANGAWAHAPFSSEYSVNQAKEEAQKRGKLLLIDFTAAWCPPCQKMEKTTWADNAVQTWIKENAIAIQVDVDKDEKTSSKFRISAMPTLVLFTPQSGEKEFGRQDGYLSSAELMKWLQGAKDGKSSAEIEKEMEATDCGALWEHMGKARELQSAGNALAALDEYIWLWNNIQESDPNSGPIRIGVLPTEMKKLCDSNAETKAKVLQMREAADKANNRHDWIILNGILGENPRTLAWFDKAKTDPSQQATFQKEIKSLEGVLFSASRWADAAKYLYPDPMAKIKEYYKQAETMKHPGPDTEVSKNFNAFPPMIILLYAAYVGAGRDAEAEKIAAESLRLDSSAEMKQALENTSKGMLQARASASASSAQSKSAPTNGSLRNSAGASTAVQGSHTPTPAAASSAAVSRSTAKPQASKLSTPIKQSK